MSTVFVIDDDASMRRALARLFSSAGHEVEAFPSPHEFLARLPFAGTGCLVLDIQMPGMTGPELHDRMTRQGLTLPIVFLTGHGDIPTSVQAMKQGAVDFLVKPVDDKLLLQVVEAALARHAAGSLREGERRAILERFSRLSERQREVLYRVIRGRLNKQIADDLAIALKTVKVHRSRVMQTMQCDSVAELVRACEAAGIDAKT